MTLRTNPAASGRLVELEFTSRVLADNPLGDPACRRFTAWLPPQYDQPAGRAAGPAAGTAAAPAANRGAGRTSAAVAGKASSTALARVGGRRFPVLWDLAGYLSAGPAHTGWRGFEENLPERLARLVHERRMPPAIVVFPDCFTSLGGNQYINSGAIGRYADYLVRELVPFVDRELRTLAGRDHRGLFGKSSGGYGALVHGMQHPETWGGVAMHAGDCYFDFCYRPDWPQALDTLARHRPQRRRAAAEAGLARGLDDGRVAAFLAALRAHPRPSGDTLHALMMLGMAASYDADAKAPNGFRLPFHLETGEFLPARWERWLRHDPVHMVDAHLPALRSLRALYIDCGWRDQYRMHYGARQLSRQLSARRVRHQYEEFDGTHSGIDHRLDISLPVLARALRG
jgi:S-formylglutathione hydrolase FrmB